MRHENRSLRSVRSQKGAAQIRSSWASFQVPQWCRRLRVEPLECRQLLTAVSWDGGGDGSNWSDPINWSGDALPGATDDVTINVAGVITVTHASGSTTIGSVNSAENLVISGGSLTVTNGASVVSGSLNVGTLASVTANGATTTFTASGATTIDGSNLFASAGGQLNLALATSYAEAPSNLTQLVANGAGSQIDLSGVTSLTGTTGAMNIYAQAGGTVNLAALASTTAADINLQADGATSVLNLTALASDSDTSLASTLTLANGGTLTAPAFATYFGGSISVTNMTAAIATLTNMDSTSLFANANGILTLAGITSYAEAPSNLTSSWPMAPMPKIDLPNLTSLTGTTGSMNIFAQAGGYVKMTALVSTTARDVNFLADGASSVLNLVAF